MSLIYHAVLLQYVENMAHSADQQFGCEFLSGWARSNAKTVRIRRKSAAALVASFNKRISLVVGRAANDIVGL
jgi:hypothetical protein